MPLDYIPSNFVVPNPVLAAVSHPLSLCFNGHFPGEAGLAGTRIVAILDFIEARMMELAVTTGAVRRAKIQPNCHHQQTNTEIITGRMPFMSNSVEAVMVKMDHNLRTCSPQIHLWSSNFTFDHERLQVGYLGSPLSQGIADVVHSLAPSVQYHPGLPAPYLPPPPPGTKI